MMTYKTRLLKKEHKTTEIVVEVNFTSAEPYALKALLDSGKTATMLLEKFVQPSASSKYK